jgi:hypothetical protein
LEWFCWLKKKKKKRGSGITNDGKTREEITRKAFRIATKVGTSAHSFIQTRLLDV